MSSRNIPFESTSAPTKYAGFYGFRVGTCEGLWRGTKDAYEILAVVNTKKGNGHFREAMLWFEQSARRDNKTLIVLECWNLRLALMLRRNGFTWRPLFDWQKSFV